jgi:crossover junction endodeoxyribonuclease RuvC
VRVMGVDPGLTRCGLGVVEGGLGKPLRMIAVGVIRTPTADDPAMRLLALQVEIDMWLARHEPDVVAVERVFAKANIKGIMGTAQASAVPMLAAARLGLPLAMHTPTEVKAAVTGNGRADKAQVTAMVTRILRLDTPPKPADAADALALAICQVWRGTAQNRLQDAVAAQLERQRRSHEASCQPPARPTSEPKPTEKAGSR